MSRMAGRLADKVAIVTGAGSRGPGVGNGKAAAILFAREGARVLCVDQAKERAEETVGLIRAEQGVADAFAADVTCAADCRAMVGAAVDRWGGLDVLHNNVGIESRHGLMETTEAEWDRVMAVDLKSMLLASQAAVPALERRGGGSIICVSSIAGLRGYGRTAYAAAKAGVIGFVTSVAVQLGPRRIRVNAIAPGTVWTPMVEDLGPEARERRRRATPLGTEGTAWDVAWGALYLASDESRWVTGHVLVIDGGLVATTSEGGRPAEGGSAALGEGATPPHTPRPTAPRA
jgi:NAD(P)-dependent dehydrogenase (short-subunit alcohol dehydrogenase family)